MVMVTLEIFSNAISNNDQCTINLPCGSVFLTIKIDFLNLFIHSIVETADLCLNLSLSEKRCHEK